jgi:hypothetical protein
MSDLGAVVMGITARREAMSQSGGSRERMVRAASMEKIMSKTNMHDFEDSSNLSHDTLDNHRPLADSELDTVIGGLVVIPIIGILVGLLLPAVNSA